MIAPAPAFPDLESSSWSDSYEGLAAQTSCFGGGTASGTTELFQALSEAMPEAFAAFSANGRCVSSNRKFAEFFGLMPDHLPGSLEQLRAAFSLCFLSDDLFGQKWMRLWQSGAAGFTDEWEIVSPSVRSLEVTVRFLSDGGRVIVWRDATVRRHLKQALFQSEKLQAIGMLAGGIAHDFNNLLTAVNGNITLAMEGIAEGRKPADVIPLLGSAAQAAHGGRDLVKKLMLHARTSGTEAASFELRGLVTDVRSLLKHSISPLILVEVHLPKNLWHAIADRGSVQQVMLNLCVNAVDALKNSPDARLSISGGNHPQIVPRRPSGGAPADFVSLEVRDNGPGILAPVLARIFEPLFTTKAAGEGTGLGLANCREIVEKHGGWIECESKPGHGAAFRFFLPRGGIPAVTVKTEPPKPAAKSRGTERVLVVDDDFLVRTVSAKLLSAAGYQVTTANDGVAALEWLREPGHEVDIIMLDLAMPRLSGIDTMHEIRNICPGVPVVLCSGSLSLSSPQAFQQAHGELPDATVCKPYEVIELTRTIRSTLDARPAKAVAH